MKKLLFAILLLAGFALNAQEKTAVIYDENAELRKVSSFTAISVSSAIDLYLTQSNKNDVAVSASNDEIRDHIITEVVGGTLIIRLGDKGNWMSWRKSSPAASRRRSSSKRARPNSHAPPKRSAPF